MNRRGSIEAQYTVVIDPTLYVEEIANVWKNGAYGNTTQNASVFGNGKNFTQLQNVIDLIPAGKIEEIRVDIVVTAQRALVDYLRNQTTFEQRNDTNLTLCTLDKQVFACSDIGTGATGLLSSETINSSLVARLYFVEPEKELKSGPKEL